MVRQHSLLGASGQDRGVPTVAFWERPLGGYRDLPGRGSIPAKEATSTEFSRPVSVLVADGPVCGGEGSLGRHWVRHEAEGQLGMGLCCLPSAPGLSAGLLAACADICTHAHTRVRAVPLTLTADVSTHIPYTVPPHRPRGLPSVSIAHLHTPGPVAWWAHGLTHPLSLYREPCKIPELSLKDSSPRVLCQDSFRLPRPLDSP